MLKSNFKVKHKANIDAAKRILLGYDTKQHCTLFASFQQGKTEVIQQVTYNWLDDRDKTGLVIIFSNINDKALKSKQKNAFKNYF